MTEFKEEYVKNNKPIAVLGDTGSGKTNLAFYFCSLMPETKKFLLGYPKEVEGYTRLNDIDELGQLHNCILLIDEYTKYFPVWEKKTNYKLLELLQFAEHNQIKLILTTQLSQAITKQTEAYIKTWAIKQVNIRRLKNWGTPKYVIRNIKHPRITQDYMRLMINEYIWYNEQSKAGENRIYNFPFMNVGKDWNTTEEYEKVECEAKANTTKIEEKNKNSTKVEYKTPTNIMKALEIIKEEY